MRVCARSLSLSVQELCLADLVTITILPGLLVASNGGRVLKDFHHRIIIAAHSCVACINRSEGTPDTGALDWHRHLGTQLKASFVARTYHNRFIVQSRPCSIDRFFFSRILCSCPKRAHGMIRLDNAAQPRAPLPAFWYTAIPAYVLLQEPPKKNKKTSEINSEDKQSSLQFGYR